jgi:septum formation protein
MTIYLASKSPRRKELLMQMEVSFEVLDVDIPEIMNPEETPETYSVRITEDKLNAAWDKMMADNLTVMPILCADTEVVLDGVILGKPQDYQDAFNMLKSYSNRSHEVLTSVGLKSKHFENIITNTTIVTFAELSDEAIHHYLEKNNYLDKSGAYGIQSYIGQFISHIEGCFYSVMGLPLNTVNQLLRAHHERC